MEMPDGHFSYADAIALAEINGGRCAARFSEPFEARKGGMPDAAFFSDWSDISLKPIISRKT